VAWCTEIFGSQRTAAGIDEATKDMRGLLTELRTMQGATIEQRTTERFQVAESLAVRGYEDAPLAWLNVAWC
jgi:hypothetical protein